MKPKNSFYIRKSSSSSEIFSFGLRNHAVMKSLIIQSLIFLTLFSCNRTEKLTNSPSNNTSAESAHTRQLSEKEYHNKVLGLLIGSAIGDAMGAPTEMWSRKDIQSTYGFVDKLDTMVRNPSGEGTWQFNLPAGGTTDDTRWKKLFTGYAIDETWPNLKAANLAQHIIEKYKTDIEALKSTEGFNPEPYEQNIMKMAWLQEWAIVADAYVKNDMVDYSSAVNKFYGGEMTCAGMLYSPMIGACIPADPQTAYESAYELSIFDIGYARDITALVAAMVSQAFDSSATKSSIAGVIRNIDPEGYYKSRLVGRAAHRYYQIATGIVSESKNLALTEKPKGFKIPHEWKGMDSLTYLQLTHAYSLLDKLNQDMPFHAGEVYLITITAMMYSEYDFEKTMQFIVNYGRDNDTVAAVAGAILGAYLGADNLPPKTVDQILRVNKDLLGNDLNEMATAMTKKYLSQYTE